MLTEDERNSFNRGVMAGELQAPPPPSLQSLEHFLHLRNSTLLQAQRARARARARVPVRGPLGGRKWRVRLQGGQEGHRDGVVGC